MLEIYMIVLKEFEGLKFRIMFIDICFDKFYCNFIVRPDGSNN